MPANAETPPNTYTAKSQPQLAPDGAPGAIITGFGLVTPPAPPVIAGSSRQIGPVVQVLSGTLFVILRLLTPVSPVVSV